MISGLVGFALANLLSEQQLQDFGWRIAFLVGAAIVPFGLMLRRSLPETFHASDAGKRERVSLRPYLFVAVIGLVLLASSTIGTYITSYMTTYAIATLHMRANIAFAATVVVGLTGVVFDLVSGALSDKIGRKPMMLIPGVVLLVSILPAFDLISHYRTTPILLGATAVLTTLLVLSSCPIVIWLTESFPTAIRSGSVSVVYALSIALFGGTTQFSVTWLIRRTGNPLAPAWYWTVAAGVSIAAMCATHESAPCKLAKRRIAVQAASLTGPVG
jgi:MFS family permease